MGNDYVSGLAETILSNNAIDKHLYAELDVKRGLRNADGSGVLAGLTKLSSVVGSKKIDGKMTAVEGNLRYRGIDIREIVQAIQQDKRHGFSEVIHLLLLGTLPKPAELNAFEDHLKQLMVLPQEFVVNSILQMPSTHVMNALQRSVLSLYVLDENADDTNIPNVLRQSLNLIAKFPAMTAYAYLAMRNKLYGEALFINPPRPEYDLAENFLYMLRPTGEFTALEAELLDLALILHAEHGGGNNSSFTCHVVSSSLTDSYSAIAAAIGSLKGPLHGAANASVMGMMNDIKAHVKDWRDRDEVAAYVTRIIKKEAYNKTGLVYGIGHAVYTQSDPRAIVLKGKARELAKAKNRLDEFELYLNVEATTPEIFASVKGSDKVIAPNVDFFSGFVYDMLGLELPIYTPMFAMARVVGWSAHRMDEIINGGRIIRPGYKSVAEAQSYIPISKR
jgi:citrate synthase